MKISVLLSCSALCIIGFSAFSYFDLGALTEQQTTSEIIKTAQEEIPGFVYDIDSRYLKTVTKSDLLKATSVSDLFTLEETKGIESFSDVTIVVHNSKGNIVKKGPDGRFTDEQLVVLHDMDYSTNFNIEAFCKKKNSYSMELEKSCFVYYVSLIPENEATYKFGNDGLIYCLQENSRMAVANIDLEKVKAGKVQFTVTTDGNVENTILSSSSGYTTVDDKMIELIKNMPQKWNPATDAEGNPVSQTLFFSFGRMGC